MGLNFVLLHGSWHDGAHMEPVAEALRAQGHAVVTPTIAGHGKDADKSVSLEDSIDSIADLLEEQDLRDVVLVGHSFAGLVVQGVAERQADRLQRLVFHNAFVLKDGESLVDTLPPHLQEAWPHLVGPDDGLVLPFGVWRDGFIGEADLDTAQSAYDTLSATPQRSHFDKLSLPAFATLPVPRSYLWARDDNIFGHTEQWSWFPRFPHRLGAHRLITMPGGHEVCLLTPAALADHLVLAGRP